MNPAHTRGVGGRGIETIGQDFLGEHDDGDNHADAQHRCRQRGGAGKLGGLAEEKFTEPRRGAVEVMGVCLLRDEAKRQ